MVTGSGTGVAPAAPGERTELSCRSETSAARCSASGHDERGTGWIARAVERKAIAVVTSTCLYCRTSPPDSFAAKPGGPPYVVPQNDFGAV